MSDIFISYARADRDKAARLAELLERHGWAPWWDNEIPPGKTWAEVIQHALDQARCVIVLWSSASLASHWVNTEAREGLQRGILVPVLLEDVTMPLEFRSIQSANLSSWPDHASEQEVDKLVTAVGLTLGSPARQRYRHPPVTTPQKWTLVDALNLASAYFASFIDLIAGPKRFLAGVMEQRERLLKGAALFLLGSYVLGFLLTIPLPSRSLLASFFAEMGFVFFKVMAFGMAVYFSWRLVGAKAALRDFLAIHFYCAGVLQILEKAVFLSIWGLFRLLSEPAWFAQVQDALFCKAELASFHHLLITNLSVTQTVLLVIAIGAVLAVSWMVAIWGAYRRLSNVSRTRSILAGAVFVPLGLAAQSIIYFAASALLSPQC